MPALDAPGWLALHASLDDHLRRHACVPALVQLQLRAIPRPRNMCRPSALHMRHLICGASAAQDMWKALVRREKEAFGATWQLAVWPEVGGNKWRWSGMNK